MNRKILGAALGCALLAASAASAQTTATTTSFQNLSPGNQKIADALFAAQTPTGTQTALTRDQIAGLKGTEGWGRVFQQMKSEGLLSAKNLGQVVSAHEHSLHSATSSTTRSTAGAATAGHSGRTTSSSLSRTTSHRFASSRYRGTMGGYRTASSGYYRGGMGRTGYAAAWSGSSRPAMAGGYGGGFGHGGYGGGFGGGFAGGFGGGHGGGHGR